MLKTEQWTEPSPCAHGIYNPNGSKQDIKYARWRYVKKGSRGVGEELFVIERSEKVAKVRCQLRRCEEGEEGNSLSGRRWGQPQEESGKSGKALSGNSLGKFETQQEGRLHG